MSENEKSTEPEVSNSPETTETAAAAPATGHGAPVDPDKPVNPDFQDNDIQLDTVRRFMFGSIGVTLVFFVLMLIVHRIYSGSISKARGGQPEVRQIPTQGPLLQTQPLVDLAEYKALENDRLNALESDGPTARVPIEDAMRLMLEQGAFPGPSATARAEPAPETPAPAVAQAPAPVPAPAATATAPAPAAAPAAPPPAAAAAAFDAEMAAAGRVLWEQNCVVCHSGQPNAIAPDILHAFGTMRELENADPILMDEGYVINSLNNPNEHIAKGYMGVMTSFKNQFTRAQKNQIVEFLKSQAVVPLPGMEMAQPEPAPAVEAPAQPAPAAAEPAPAPAPAPAAAPQPPPAPAPEPAPAPAPAPVPAPAPAPAAPTPAPGRPAPIFI